MKHKRAISILAIIMAVLMVLSLILSVLPTAYAVTQSEIDELRKKKEEISARAKEAEELVGLLEQEQAGVLVQKAVLDGQNAAALEELDLVKQEIAMYDGIIAEKSQELQAAQQVEDEQLQRYRTRVRAMEENGRYNVLAMFFKADSYSDLLASLDDMNEIMESDKELEHEYRAARQEHERIKAEYEEVRSDCEEKQDELRQEQEKIQTQIDETSARLEELADQIEEANLQFENERAAENAAANELTQMLAAYDAQKKAEAAARAAAAAEAARQAAEEEARRNSGENVTSAGQPGSDQPWGDPNTVITDDGTTVPGADEPQQSQPTQQSGFSGFQWPVPCSSRITGRYSEGRGDHNHAGIDIDGFGNDGQAVVAAAGGTVVTAGVGGAYGNYVIIDHGNNYKTVYAHLGSLAVSEGQSVSQGQTIGTLGASGNANGTHCHFEVRINNATVDPTQYFSGYTFYDL